MKTRNGMVIKWDTPSTTAHWQHPHPAPFLVNGQQGAFFEFGRVMGERLHQEHARALRSDVLSPQRTASGADGLPTDCQ